MLTTFGILTRLIKLTDTSLIAHWFTPDVGLIYTVARGARRPKSPFAGRLDLFFSGEISVSLSRRSNLDTLREVAIGNSREGLRRSWPTTMMAGYFCQLAQTVVEPGHPEPEIFDLLRRALDHLETEDPSFRALRFFEAEIAKILGISEHPGQAESALREALGVFPSGRARILNLLSTGDTEIYPSQSRKDSK